MPSLVSWLIEDQVLTLTLYENPTTDLLEEYSQYIHQILDNTSDKIIVYLNAANLRVSYRTADMLRDTQTYVKHPNLDCIIVVAGNKLNRLIMLMAFSTAVIPVMQFDNEEQIYQYLERRGLSINDTKCG